MDINRDQYEGSPFDMTVGLDSGAYGDPMRFPPMTKFRDPVEGVSWTSFQKGLDFQRPISLWRTTYSTVTQSRSSLPDTIGAVTWIAPYAPHHSTFVPVYASAEKTPSSLNAGTQYQLDKTSNWWIHCLTSNYASRWYRYTIVDISAFQKKIEASIFKKQKKIEAQALQFLSPGGETGRREAEASSDKNRISVESHPQPELKLSNFRNVGVIEPLPKRRQLQGDIDSAAQILGDFHESTAQSVHDQWWDFFFLLAGQYRDMYKVVDLHAENFNIAYRYLTVPR
jgi:hypothetical protein